MSKVVLDAATRAKLNGLSQQLELYDEEGNLLAYCTPADPGLDLGGHRLAVDDCRDHMFRHCSPSLTTILSLNSF